MVDRAGRDEVRKYLDNWALPPPEYQRTVVIDAYDQIDALEVEIERLKGAMDSQDKRERAAGERCGVSWMEHGCDWPDRMADVVIDQRENIERLRAELSEINEGLAGSFVCPVVPDEEIARAEAEFDARNAPLLAEIRAAQAAFRQAAWASQLRDRGEALCDLLDRFADDLEPRAPDTTAEAAGGE